MKSNESENEAGASGHLPVWVCVRLAAGRERRPDDAIESHFAGVTAA